MSKDQTRDDLEREIKAIEMEAVMIATNEGTFGANECCQCVGCGDPRFGNRHVYERVGDGLITSDGPDEDRAPGYMRSFRETINERRRLLTDLRGQLRRLSS